MSLRMRHVWLHCFYYNSTLRLPRINILNRIENIRLSETIGNLTQVKSIKNSKSTRVSLKFCIWNSQTERNLHLFCPSKTLTRLTLEIY